MTHICVSKLTIFGSDNGLSPERRQANIWTNAGILLIGTLGTNFSEMLNEIHTFSFKKMHLKTSSVKRRPFCLGLSVLTHQSLEDLDEILQMQYSINLHCENALRTQGFTDNISTSVQVMAWCCQAASHYLSQCWHRSMSPYDVTSPQSLNSLCVVVAGMS